MGSRRGAAFVRPVFVLAGLGLGGTLLVRP
jgi:hypothetical protein